MQSCQPDDSCLGNKARASVKACFVLELHMFAAALHCLCEQTTHLQQKPSQLCNTTWRQRRHQSAGMTESCRDRKRPHATEKDVSPPPAKRRQQSHTTSKLYYYS